MLSRTADNLFWLARYTERAGNVARGLGVASRMAAISARLGERSPNGARCSPPPAARRASTEIRAPNAESVVDWLVFDPDNSSGILACFEAARRNARAVRTALTVDMWEALNDTWNHLRNLAPDATEGELLAQLPRLGAGTRHAVQRRGARHHAAQRALALRPSRHDAGARRQHRPAAGREARAVAPGEEGAVDYVQWQAVLRSVSALRSYQWVYRERLSPGGSPS